MQTPDLGMSAPNVDALGSVVTTPPWEKTIISEEAIARSLDYGLLEATLSAFLHARYCCTKGRISDVLAMATVLLDGLFDNSIQGKIYVKAARLITENTGMMTPYDTRDIVDIRKRQHERQRAYSPRNVDDRDRMASDVLKLILKDDGIRREGIACIVIGPPASGKTSVVTEPLKKQYGAIVIDPDDVKPLLDSDGSGAYAGVVHEDSGEIAEAAIIEAMGAKHNIVLPMIGKSLGKLRELRNDFCKMGYRLHLRLVDLPAEEAARRAIVRYYESGRFVDPSYVLYDVGNKPRRNYRILKRVGGFETYEAYTTDGPKAERPYRID